MHESHVERKGAANTPDTSKGLTRDLTGREVMILTPIALVCIAIGVYPKPMLESIEPAIRSHVVASRAIVDSGERSAAIAPVGAEFVDGGGDAGGL